MPGPAAQVPSVQTMKILLVEDDRKIGQFVKKGLEEVAYNAVWVRSCKEARDAVADGQFDVIILDAPCSGEGSFMENPDAVRLWSDKKIRGLSRPMLISLRNTC